MLRRFLPLLAILALSVPARAQFQSCNFCSVRPLTPDPFDVTDCGTGTISIMGSGFRNTGVNGCSTRPTVTVRSTRPDRVVIIAYRVVSDTQIDVDYSVPCDAPEGICGIDVTIDDNPTDTIVPYACGNLRMSTHGICGNHVLDSGESCDDGNTTDGDGCSSTCALESVLSVTWGDARAVRSVDGRVTVTWSTLAEDDTVSFDVVAMNALGRELPLPELIDARGAGSSYSLVDRDGIGTSYRVREWTASGPGSVTPWLRPVTVFAGVVTSRQRTTLRRSY